MDKSCHFTDEQWQKILKIEDGRSKAWSDTQDSVMAKTASLDKAIADANASGDHAAADALQKQFMDAYKPYNDFEKQFQDKVQALLTDKQKSDWAAQQKAWADNAKTGQAPGGGVIINTPH